MQHEARSGASLEHSAQLLHCPTSRYAPASQPAAACSLHKPLASWVTAAALHSHTLQSREGGWTYMRTQLALRDLQGTVHPERGPAWTGYTGEEGPTLWTLALGSIGLGQCQAWLSSRDA